jgi:uncharacterized protein YegP (UPF0339 family)
MTEGGPDGRSVRDQEGKESSVLRRPEGGEWRGQDIATSELYKAKSNAKEGIDSVKANAPTARVDDETGE